VTNLQNEKNFLFCPAHSFLYVKMTKLTETQKHDDSSKVEILIFKTLF